MRLSLEKLEPNESLRSANLDLYEQIYGVRPHIDPDEGERFRMEESLDGGLVHNVCESVNGEKVWIRRCSAYSPSYEASRWIRLIEFDNMRTTIAMRGFGTGYQLEAFSESLRPDTRFFIYEPEEELFAFVCAFVNLESILTSGRVMIIIPGYTAGGFRHFFENDVMTSHSQAMVFRLPGTPFDESFEDSCSMVNMRMVTERNFQRDRGRNCFINQLYAWTRLNRNAIITDLLDRLPRELPIIIATGGPSLNTNAEDLKLVGDRGLIICIDRAVSVLLKHGVKPDLLATADVDKNPDYLMADRMKDVPLLCAFQANRRTQELFDGSIIYYLARREEGYLPEIGERISKREDVGGNVASSVYTAFAEAGFKRIILVGQDLALLGKESHADGSHDGTLKHEKLIEIEGIDGGKVLSHTDWISFRDFYEDMIRFYPDTHCIDATEGGALIHGSEVMTLKDAIAKYLVKEYDIRSYINDLPRAQSLKGHDETIAMLGGYLGTLDAFAGYSKEIVETTDSLIKICRYQDIRDKAAKKKLNHLDELRIQILSNHLFDQMKEKWVKDTDSIPDVTLMVRNNDEALRALEILRKFHDQFPKDCMDLKDAIVEILGREES